MSLNLKKNCSWIESLDAL